MTGIALLERPHGETRELLATGAPVYLLVNPLEYHGPHLSLRNDLFLARGLTRDLHVRLAARHPEWPLLLGPEIEAGVGPTPGPGSVPVPFPVVRRLVRDAVLALAGLGARRVVLMTGHGDPLHNAALSAALPHLERRGIPALAPMNVVLREMLALEDPGPYADAFAGIEDASERAAMLAALARDVHAGFFETSLTLHYAPGTVSPSYATLPPCAPIRDAAAPSALARLARLVGARRLGRELDFAAYGLGWHALDPFPGYTGRPHRATAAAGAAFARHLVDRIEHAARAVLEEGSGRAPGPIMGWLPAITLGGRLAP